MMANTDRGFEVREYFIDCERRLQAGPPRLVAPALDGTPIPPRPFHEWTLEEVRTKLAVTNAYRHNFNRASAAWVMLQQGFPKPPPQLLPPWAHQSELDVERQPARNVVVVTMPGNNGSAH